MEFLETFPPALIIAILALIATAWHGYATRRHQRLTLQPILRFRTDFRRDEYKGLTLVNVGMGPAIFVSVRVWVREKEIPEPVSGGKVRAALKDMGLDMKTVNTWTISDNTVLRPNEVLELARTREKKGLDKQSWELRKALTDLDIHIKYGSSYGKYFEQRLGNLPRAVDSSTAASLESSFTKGRGEGTVVETPGDQTVGQET